MKTEDAWMWIAWKMPRKLVYWCAIRLMAHATTGDHGHHIVPEVTCLDALNRWDDPPEILPPGPEMTATEGEEVAWKNHKDLGMFESPAQLLARTRK